MTPAYTTDLGAAYIADSRTLLATLPDASIQLVITSPPFALQRQKEYGNQSQASYVEWLGEFARLVRDKLTEDGSFVLDLGGAYEKGVPVRSLYPFRTLIHLCDDIGFHLAEDFYWHNPSKLPGPVEWVTKRKIRVKDSVNTVWWLSKTPWPKTRTQQVLNPYSKRMNALLADPAGAYRPGQHPSGHQISVGFAKNNGGSIPPNLLWLPNTDSNSSYFHRCKAAGATAHPARFPPKLPEFFIRLLTDPNDQVLDIFAGSNTTGQVAQAERRRWIACDDQPDYVAASALRFLADDSEAPGVYDSVLAGAPVHLHKTPA